MWTPEYDFDHSSTAALMGFALAPFFVASLLAAEAPPVERSIYWVDVERAAVRTKKGLELLAELERARSRFEDQIRPKEEELIRLKRSLEQREAPEVRKKFETAQRALEELLSEEESRLVELEQTRIRPTLDALRTTLRAWNVAHPNATILDLEEHSLANPAASCDLTDKLIAAHDGGKMNVPKPGPPCRTRFFLYVDLSRLKYEIDTGQRALEELKALEKERELALAQTSTGAQPISRIELFAKYSTEERERRRRGRVQEQRLMLSTLAFLARTQAKLPGVTFVDIAAGAAEKIEPSCDVTNWMLDVSRGKSEMEDVWKSCRCLWISRPGKLRIAHDCRQPKPSSRYRQGDFVVYKYSGTFGKEPVTLREEVVRKDGNRLTIEVEAVRGAEKRKWLQVVTDTPENRKNNVVDELYELVGKDYTKLGNEENKDLNRLYEWTLVYPDGRSSGVRKTKVEVSFAGQQFACERTAGKNTYRGKLMRYESHDCPSFVWTNGPTRMIDLESGEDILRIDVETWGTRR